MAKDKEKKGMETSANATTEHKDKSAKKKVIIVGVAGGASCAVRRRRLDEQAEILLMLDVTLVAMRDQVLAPLDPAHAHLVENQLTRHGSARR